MQAIISSLKNEREAFEETEMWVYSKATSNQLQYNALIQRSTGWLKARKDKITASKFGVVSGLSKWEDARLYWHLLTGRIFKDNTIVDPRLAHGFREEINAIRAYEAVTRRIIEETGFFIAKEPYSYLGASPDGLIKGTNGVIEVKSPTYKVADFISPEYMAQVQGQLEICSKDFCDFCSWHSKQGLAIWRVYRSETYWKWILPFLIDFYNCLLNDVSPPPPSSDKYKTTPPAVEIESLGFYSIKDIYNNMAYSTNSNE